MSGRSDLELARAYRDLENRVCDVRSMAHVATIAREASAEPVPELVAFALNQIHTLADALHSQFYAGLGEDAR